MRRLCRGRRTAGPGVELAADAVELAEGAEHDGRIRARLPTRDARAVMDAELSDRRAREARPGDELRADHRPVGREAEPPGEVAADELERAVDVADVEVEHAADEAVPRVRVDPAHEGVHAREAVADDEVVPTRGLDEALELREVELQVGVGQEDPFAAGRGNAGPQRRSVSAVVVVMDDANPQVARGRGRGAGGRPG